MARKGRKPVVKPRKPWLLHRTPPKEKQSTLVIQREQRKVTKAIKCGEVFTTRILFGNSFRNEQRKFRRLLQKCAMTIAQNYIIDNVKAPQGNIAQSALTQSRASFDIYFGINTCRVSKETVLRHAYARGSGVTSIGLDPREVRLHNIFPEMVELMSIASEATRRHFSRAGGDCIFNTAFNTASVKLYVDGKRTGLHTDITFDKAQREPKENNSQEPNTPVAICTFGDTKYLHLIKFDKPGKDGAVKPMEKLSYRQESGSIIIFDPRDEYFHSGRKHYWKHLSELVDGNNGVSMAILFRVSQVAETVHSATGHFLDVTIGGTGKKRAQFDEGWEAINKLKDVYERNLIDVLGKIQIRLESHCK